MLVAAQDTGQFDVQALQKYGNNGNKCIDAYRCLLTRHAERVKARKEGCKGFR